MCLKTIKRFFGIEQSLPDYGPCPWCLGRVEVLMWHGSPNPCQRCKLLFGGLVHEQGRLEDLLSEAVEAGGFGEKGVLRFRAEDRMDWRMWRLLLCHLAGLGYEETRKELSKPLPPGNILLSEVMKMEQEIVKHRNGEL